MLHHKVYLWLWSAMPRSSGFFSQVSLFFVLILAGLCGCGGVDHGDHGGPSQAVIAFAITPNSIVQGQTATLTWQVANAVSFSISPPVASGPLPMSGSASVSPSQTTTYTATASDAKGRPTSATATLTLAAAGPAPTIAMTFAPTVVGSGQSTTLTWNSTNATAVS